jgi:hypothetical protein
MPWKLKLSFFAFPSGAANSNSTNLEPNQSIKLTAKDAKDAKEKLQIPMTKFQGNTRASHGIFGHWNLEFELWNLEFGV